MGSALAEGLEAVTRVVAAVTGRPFDEVHLIFEESSAGRVAFGGGIVKDG